MTLKKRGGIIPNSAFCPLTPVKFSVLGVQSYESGLSSATRLDDGT